MPQENKSIEYAAKIQFQIMELFNPETEGASTHIDMKEFNDEKNLKAFLHGLTMASTNLFNKLVQEDKNFLEFNHVANLLCFEFMTLSTGEPAIEDGGSDHDIDGVQETLEHHVFEAEDAKDAREAA